jgi:hypothetical protein
MAALGTQSPKAGSFAYLIVSFRFVVWPVLTVAVVVVEAKPVALLVTLYVPVEIDPEANWPSAFVVSVFEVGT